MAGRRGRKIDPNSVTQRVLSAHLDEAGLASQGRDLFAGHGAGTTHKYRTRCG